MQIKDFYNSINDTNFAFILLTEKYFNLRSNADSDDFMLSHTLQKILQKTNPSKK